MTEYERGLRDAAAICRQQAKSCIPYRTVGWMRYGRVFGRWTRIGKRYQAKMAIRCAQAIEKMIAQ